MAYSSNVHIEDINYRISIPPRSRLFGLDPIGIGSVKAEGLISYIIRLAKAHCISPRLLISAELLPRMREVNSARHAEFYSDYAKTLQSTGKFSSKFVEMVEQLTCRTDIALLTALPWREIVPSIGTGLMTQHPKWCSACLAEDRTNHDDTYFRLSWGFALYQTCTRHQLQLVDECPWCAKHQPFFTSHAEIGRCEYCNGWLGTNTSTEDMASNQQLLWISSAIEEMIANGETAVHQITGDLLRKRLTELVNTLAGGQKTKLSEMLGLTRSTMASWITKRQKPLFPQFLYLCYQLEVMPSEFLLDFNAQKAKFVYKPNTDKFHHILPKIGLQEPSKADIYLKLKIICNDANDCRPLTEIAADLSLTRKYLLYWFPAECELISLKHKQSIHQIAMQRRKEQILSVRNITWQLYSKGLYPSNRKVAEFIAPLKLSLLKPHLRATHRKTLKELGL